MSLLFERSANSRSRLKYISAGEYMGQVRLSAILCKFGFLCPYTAMVMSSRSRTGIRWGLIFWNIIYG
jgi:hypothetical protein